MLRNDLYFARGSVSYPHPCHRSRHLSCHGQNWRDCGLCKPPPLAFSPISNNLHSHSCTLTALACIAAFARCQTVLVLVATATPTDNDVINVMWVCAGVSVAGLLVTVFFCKETRDLTIESLDAMGKDALDGGAADDELSVRLVGGSLQY